MIKLPPCVPNDCTDIDWLDDDEQPLRNLRGVLPASRNRTDVRGTLADDNRKHTPSTNARRQHTRGSGAFAKRTHATPKGSRTPAKAENGREKQPPQKPPATTNQAVITLLAACWNLDPSARLPRRPPLKAAPIAHARQGNAPLRPRSGNTHPCVMGASSLVVVY
jgi:hypothetical protein